MNTANLKGRCSSPANIERQEAFGEEHQQPHQTNMCYNSTLDINA